LFFHGVGRQEIRLFIHTRAGKYKKKHGIIRFKKKHPGVMMFSKQMPLLNVGISEMTEKETLKSPSDFIFH
jgi:hypothetical protein